MQINSGSTSIPIILGVTGHRDIPKEDEMVLKNKIKQYLLDEILSKYKNSPVYLLSALAEGADRIAAHAILELELEQEQKKRIKLGVILPMHQNEYAKDFISEGSLKEFNALLQSATFVINACPALEAPEGEMRDKCYQEAGLWIARYSHLLIALWDGINTGKIGGTSDIINIFRKGIPIDLPDKVTVPDCGQVVHFMTRRTINKSPIQAELVGTLNILPPKPAGITSFGEEQRLETIFKRIDIFNEKSRNFLDSEKGGLKFKTSLSYLLEQHHDKLNNLGGKAKSIADFYAIADALSIDAAGKRKSLFVGIIMSAFIALFAQAIYSGPFLEPWWLLTAIGLAILSFWFYWKMSKEQIEDQYQDYRTLAEGARVHFFWTISGIQKKPADYYLRDQRDELEWIRKALNTLDIPLNNESPALIERDRLQISLDDWVLCQKKYFNKKGPLQDKDDKRLSTIAGRLLFWGFLLVVLNLVFHIFLSDRLPIIGDWIIKAFIVMYGSLFAASGAVKLYSEVMAYREQANRYKKMSLYYTLCEKHVVDAIERNDFDDARDAFIEIGKQALAENGEWLLLHRRRPVEVPLGG